MTLHVDQYQSPIGPLFLVGSENTIFASCFESQWTRAAMRYGTLKEGTTRALSQTRRQLEEYFNGERREFNLPYALEGTAFQLRTWKALLGIPFGQTAPYSKQALAIESPNAVRAVGRTNGLNLLCIILPCHRVIGKNGELTGYAGGLSAKKYLLDLEQAVVQREKFCGKKSHLKLSNDSHSILQR